MKDSLKEKSPTQCRVSILAPSGISSQAVSKWMSQGRVPLGE
jgi:hypothetical protein